jgi:hypothetical protein
MYLLNGPKWTRNLPALVTGCKKMAAQMEETLCRVLLDDIRRTPAPDTTWQESYKSARFPESDSGSYDHGISVSGPCSC